MFRFGIVLCGLLAGAGVGQAADLASPAGAWRTIDDKTGQPRGLVRIYEQAGKFYGLIEKSFNPSPKPTCTACTDDRKDQPMKGLVIIRGMVRHGDEYGDGDILDPDSGTIYHCSFHLEQGGTRLAVRGYVGISLLGRTQMWVREE
jgi:uncharacterized protein (DUF2147 family)